MRTVQIAGALDDFGDSLIDTAASWGDRILPIALIIIVIITILRKVSFKAAIGALIAMVLAMGIYNSRDSLSKMVEDEVNNPAGSAGVEQAPGGAGDQP
ncbi:hypothetical protein ACWD01_33505 [Streptomyces sp. NPDC002835]